MTLSGSVLRRCRTLLVVTGVAALAALAAPVAAEAGSAPWSLPDRYVVSRAPGVLPEGIGVGPDGSVYVTASGNGAVYRGSVWRPHLAPFVPAGRNGRDTAAGVHVDRFGRVFVARPGSLDVYGPHGRLIASRPAPDGVVGPASLNDLVITRDAVYVTDFANPVVLRASLHHGRLGPLRPWLDTSRLVPQLPAQYWYLNGIVASRDQRTLLVSSQGLEQLLRVDVADADASLVDLGDTTFAADGLVLCGSTVYAVLNYDPPAGQGVYRADLSADLSSGTVEAVRTSGLDSPTTLARVGSRLLVVNSQLDHPPGTPPFIVSTVPIR